MRKKLAKTDLRYWKERVFKPVYSAAPGVTAQAPNWAVEIQHRGRRHRWSLGTPNQAAAAAKAKELYIFLQANGWEMARAKYRPGPVGEQKNQDATVGEFLALLKAKADTKPKTLEGYAR